MTLPALRSADAAVLTDNLQDKPKLTISEWAAKHVYFPGKANGYESEFEGRFNPEFLPFWNEPMDAQADPDVKETTVLKCAQGGGTENVGLIPIRYFVATSPLSVLWVHSQQELAEALMEERLKPALEKCCDETAIAYAKAKTMGMQIYFANMLIAVTWSTSIGGLKQRPIGFAFLDEVSTHTQESIAKVRKRLETVPFAHMVKCSSPDKRKNRAAHLDPIILEFRASDQRYWFMDDPGKAGEVFRFQMGWKVNGHESRYGLKWDQEAKREDGSWDLEKVRASAHYVTPAGTVIQEKDRVAIMRKGRWKATNPNAPYWHRGYHVSSFMMPWITLGDMAVKFLSAKEMGKDALRVFILEDLAEEWKEGVDEIPQDMIEQRTYIEREVATGKTEKYRYDAGVRFSTVEPWKTIYIKKPTKIFMTGDVQKFDLRYLVREWVKGGDSGLIEWGSIALWDDYQEKAKEFKASRVLIDYGYAERRQEVLEASFHYNFIPTRGFDYRLSMPFQQALLNPFEGTKRQKENRQIAVMHFDTDVFKSQLLSRITGATRKGWYVYAEPELQYVQEVTSEYKMNGKWLVKQGMHNEGWDMEVLQILAATRFGFNSLEFAKPPPAGAVAQAA